MFILSIKFPQPQPKNSLTPVGLTLLSAFDGVLTAMKIEGRWVMIDAVNSDWQINNSSEMLKGRNVIILGKQLQMANF